MATPMMRVNFFYRDITGKGWSETFFNTGTQYSTVRALAINLSTLLLNVRGTGVILDELRVSDDNAKRDSTIYVPSDADSKTQFPSFLEGDFADVALLCRLEATEANRRSLYLSGIPDVMTLQNGIFKPTATWIDQFGFLRNELFKNGWAQKCLSPTGMPNQVVLITQNVVSGDYVLTTLNPHGFTPGQLVNVTGARETPGVNGRHIVKAVGNPSQFQFKSTSFLGNWTGITFVQGVSFVLKTFTLMTYERLVEHKRGKPIGSSHGRRSVA
jgi:hypothetical protein